MSSIFTLSITPTRSRRGICPRRTPVHVFRHPPFTAAEHLLPLHLTHSMGRSHASMCGRFDCRGPISFLSCYGAPDPSSWFRLISVVSEAIPSSVLLASIWSALSLCSSRLLQTCSAKISPGVSRSRAQVSSLSQVYKIECPVVGVKDYDIGILVLLTEPEPEHDPGLRLESRCARPSQLRVCSRASRAAGADHLQPAVALVALVPLAIGCAINLMKFDMVFGFPSRISCSSSFGFSHLD